MNHHQCLLAALQAQRAKHLRVAERLSMLARAASLDGRNEEAVLLGVQAEEQDEEAAQLASRIIREGGTL